MSWGLVAAGVATVAGAVIQREGAEDAANAAARGSDRAIAASNRTFDLIRSDATPAIQLGHSAIDRLNRLYGYTPRPLSTGQAPYSTGGSSSGGGGPGGRSVTQATDPLGLYSGGSVNARRVLDPIGIFSSGGGFDAGPRPAGMGPTRFKPSDVIRRFQAGMSIEDIAKEGWLSPNEREKEIGYLLQAGLTPEQIGRLQGRKTQNPATIDGATGQVVEEGRPDLSVFFESPDYQFNLAEGQKAIDRSLAARGRSLSGAGVREGVRYASGMASREYEGFVNRLMAQAGLAQTASSTSAGAGVANASQVGNAAINAGNARGSAYLSGANATAGAIRGGAQDFLLYQYLNPSSGGRIPYGGGTPVTYGSGPAAGAVVPWDPGSLYNVPRVGG